MNKDNIIALTVLVILIVFFPLLSPSPYNLSIAIFAGINALLAIGLSILMGYAGQISLGQAGFYGIGAYVSAILSLKAGIPVLLSILFAASVAGISAVLLAVPALRLRGHYLAVATLGFGEIIYIILNEFGPGGPSGFGDIPRLSILGYFFDSSTNFFYLTWTVVTLAMIFSINLIDSRIGRALRAMHDSEIACKAMGLDIVSLKIKVFVLSAIFASLAGSLYAHYVTFVSPSSFSLFHSVLIVMMAVLGGINNLWGAILGAIIITILPELLRKFEEFDVLVYGLILTFSLLFFRKGLVPIFIDKLKKLRA
ncbi:MAG: branched-chain amino acid ABC transporter permease [Thermodesulfovibrionales bacterium]|nr:branched-chain amino acid ABC transporter permease [Thermodesulfovibrionales bacterium]